MYAATFDMPDLVAADERKFQRDLEQAERNYHRFASYYDSAAKIACLVDMWGDTMQEELAELLDSGDAIGFYCKLKDMADKAMDKDIQQRIASGEKP